MTRLPLLLALVVACSDSATNKPDGGFEPDVCTDDADCGPGRICDGALCTFGERTTNPDALRVEPPSLSFGSVQIGARPKKTLSLSAVGSDVLVSEITFVRAEGTAGPEELAITTEQDLPKTIRAGDSLVVTVTYVPRDAVADRGDVVIRLGGGAIRKVPVTSTQDGEPALGVVASLDVARTQLRSGATFAQVPAIDFGKVEGTAIVEKRFQLVNSGTGNTPLAITGVSLASDGAADFTIETTPAVPSVAQPTLLPALRAEATDLLAVQSLEVILRFKPTVACPRTSSLLVLVAGVETPRTLFVSGERTALSGEDADSDGKPDACDACPHDANDDADDDGACADVDNCPTTPNRDQADTDQNGTGDACQVASCVQDGPTDADNDGVCTPADNCPAAANADQKDADGDGLGDACDPCTKGGATDSDNDGICTPADNCPAAANTDQKDFDADGTGDACDPCTKGGATDPDTDGVCGSADNCPAIANATQSDGDGDGTGDACDTCTKGGATDPDNDGVCNPADKCPNVADPNQLDGDSDGIGDACDACPNNALNDADGDGVCDVSAPPTPAPGNYVWSRMLLPSLGNLVSVDFPPNGAFFVALEANNFAHIITWGATPTDRKIDIRSAITPAQTTTLALESVRFDPTGTYALIAGTDVSGTSTTAVVWKLDVAAAATASSTAAQIFTKLPLNPPLTGERGQAVRFPFGAGKPTFLATSSVSGGSYIARLRDIDVTTGNVAAGTLHATNSGFGECTSFDFTKDEFGSASYVLSCNFTLWFWSPNYTGGNGSGWRQNSEMGTSNTGNMGMVASHRFSQYALVMNTSSNSPPIFQFKPTPGQVAFTNVSSINCPQCISGVRFQQLGQRALFFGSYRSYDHNVNVFEYRHGTAFTTANFVAVPISGFNVSPWPASSGSWYSNDLAFRPNCDGGVLVGGNTSNTGFIARFQIDNGTACQ